MAKQISKRDKTSLVIDRAKASRVQKILGTKTLAATVDAAFDEVIGLDGRRRIMDRIRRDGGIGPSPEEVRRLRARLELAAYLAGMSAWHRSGRVADRWERLLEADELVL